MSTPARTRKRVYAKLERQSEPGPDDLVDINKFCRTIGVAPQTLRQWIAEDKVPRPIKLGSTRNAPIRWRWRTIVEWIAAQEAPA